MLGDSSADPLYAFSERIALADPDRAAQCLGEQVERRARAQRIAATHPDRDLG